MKVLIEKINQILAKWDPVEVGETIASDEYKGYIPIILKSINDKTVLMDCLTHILMDSIGLEYNPSNKLHVKDVEDVCVKILQVYNLYKISK